MKQELKPCPFCGGQARLSYEDVGHNAPWADFVECVDCGLRTHSYEADKETPVTRWNTRAADARVQLLAKAMQVVPISHPRAVVIGARDGQQVCLNGEALMQALSQVTA